MSRWVHISVRVQSKQQRARLAKAAKARRMSLNNFIVDAAESRAEEDRSQLSKKHNQLRIEQLVELDGHPLTYPEQNNHVTQPTNNLLELQEEYTKEEL